MFFVVAWALLCWWEAVSGAEAAFVHEQRADFTRRPLHHEVQWLRHIKQRPGLTVNRRKKTSRQNAIASLLHRDLLFPHHYDATMHPWVNDDLSRTHSRRLVATEQPSHTAAMGGLCKMKWHRWVGSEE
jgi:hypothetical protein